jgi:hypothetical protein
VTKDAVRIADTRIGGKQKKCNLTYQNYIQQLDYNENVSAEYPKIARGTMEYI